MLTLASMGAVDSSFARRCASSAATPLLVLTLLGFLFALQATSIPTKSLTYDAPDHLLYGLRILHGDATRFDDSKMPVSAWNAFAKRTAEEIGEGALRDFLAADGTARYPTILASLILAWLVFRWSRQLYGEAAGLTSLGLYVLDPNLLAHSRFVTTDLYASLTVTLAVYTFWRFLESPEGRGRWLRGLGAALALGLAQVAKYTGAYLVPILLLVTAVRFIPSLARNLRHQAVRCVARQLGAFALWAAVFLVVMVLTINAAFLCQDLFWPLADVSFRSEPFRELRDELVKVWPGASLPLPYPYIEGLDWVLARDQTGAGYGHRYLLGETRSDRGFLGYYVIACLFKVPLPTQVVWLSAFIIYLGRQVRGPRSRFEGHEALLLVPVAFFALYFNLLFQAQIGIRHFLVVFPFLHVFAGSLISPSVWGGLRSPVRRSLTVAGAVLAMWLAASVLSYYPHFLPYMNELLPDRKLAYKVLSDSNLDWGQDAEFIASYLQKHPDLVWQPDQPVAGRILVGTNWLTGVFEADHDTWLRAGFQPVGHLRYSHLIFEVTEEEAAWARRQLSEQSVPSPRPMPRAATR